MQAKGVRAQYLDLLKTLLVVGMVLAHVIQLIGIRVRPIPFSNGFSDFINLVTFSGFMLAFGIGVGLSRGGARPLSARLKPVWMMLAASYVSAFAFVLLVDRRPLSPELLVDLLSLRVLYGWSEFLASFFVLYLLLVVARPALVAIAGKWWLLTVAIALCFASTFVTTSVNVPLSATIVANTNYANFPLLAYLPWFLFGIRLGQEGGRLRWWYWPVALVATGYFYWQTAQAGGYPSRFPPSIAWVIGPAAFLLAYVALSQAIAHFALPAVILTPGRHVLMYLVLSNLIIFAARNRFGQPIHQFWQAALVAIAILLAITVFALAYEAWGRRGRPEVLVGQAG